MPTLETPHAGVKPAAARRPGWTAGLQRWRGAAVTALGAMTGVAALELGGWPAAASAVVLAAVAGAWLSGGNARRKTDVVAGTGAAPAAEGRSRDTKLALQLVPVWQRNVEAARSHSERSMGTLIENFGNVATNLDKALGAGTGGDVVSLEAGATDQLLERHGAEMRALLDTTREMAQVKDEALAAMQSVRDELAGMAKLAGEVQSIGRATHLLALNASVEASRAGTHGTGFAVVAQEVRSLAGQSRECGNRLQKHLTVLDDRLGTLARKARQTDTEEDELMLRSETAARGVVRALLGSLAEVSRSSRDLRNAGRQIHSDIEQVFVGLQSQDRLSQMLQSVSEDMTRYSSWLCGADDPAAVQPADWLARLEASYTMEDMRSSHHGSVVVDQSAGVEFF